MTEHRLIAAMEEEIAARITEVDRAAAEAIRRLEAETEETIRAAEAAEEARAAERCDAYQRQQRARFENEWRARWRNLQFEIAVQVLTEVQEALAQARQRADYAAIWQRLWAEARQVYGQQCAELPLLRVAAQDEVLAQTQRGQVAAITADPRLRDGVELCSPDGRIRVTNTLAARLEKGRDEFLKIIADTLQEQMAPSAGRCGTAPAG